MPSGKLKEMTVKPTASPGGIRSPLLLWISTWMRACV